MSFSLLAHARSSIIPSMPQTIPQRAVRHARNRGVAGAGHPTAGPGGRRRTPRRAGGDGPARREPHHHPVARRAGRAAQDAPDAGRAAGVVRRIPGRLVRGAAAHPADDRRASAHGRDRPGVGHTAARHGPRGRRSRSARGPGTRRRSHPDAASAEDDTDPMWPEVLQWALKPFLIRTADVLTRRVALDGWRRGRCPVCARGARVRRPHACRASICCSARAATRAGRSTAAVRTAATRRRRSCGRCDRGSGLPGDAVPEVRTLPEVARQPGRRAAAAAVLRSGGDAAARRG